MTIGNFDGVHLGHRAIVEQMRASARRRGLPTAVVLFEPQPQEYFQPARALPRLTRLREKCELLAAAGIDRVICLNFTAPLASQEAEQFVRDLIVQGLAAAEVVIGDDFCFGRARRGNFDLLRQMGSSHGFEVQRAATFSMEGARVSSTRVRDALAAADLDRAAALLGRPYTISGRVAHGFGNGQRMGYPTANIELMRRAVALRGIYAARVHGLASEPLAACAYIGRRPVINGTRELLEVHLLDYDQDCYGRHLRCEFVRFLRGDLPFDSFDALKARIAIDIREARAALAATPAPAGRSDTRFSLRGGGTR